MYIPQKTIKDLVDEYVDAIFQYMPSVGDGTLFTQDVKDVAYTIIPDTKPAPFTNRVIASGVVYCALIMCNKRITHREFRSVSKRGEQLKTIGIHSISNGARYVRDFNKLDIIW